MPTRVRMTTTHPQTHQATAVLPFELKSHLGGGAWLEKESPERDVHVRTRTHQESPVHQENEANEGSRTTSSIKDQAKTRHL